MVRNRAVGGTENGVYVWELIVPGNACGVASGEARALQALADALRAAPVGAEGIVRAAFLPSGTRSGYIYADLLATGRHAVDGTVVWRDGGADG